MPRFAVCWCYILTVMLSLENTSNLRLIVTPFNLKLKSLPTCFGLCLSKDCQVNPIV